MLLNAGRASAVGALGASLLLVGALGAMVLVAGCSSGASKVATITSTSLLPTTSTIPGAVAVMPAAVQSIMSVTDSTGNTPKVSTWTTTDTRDGSYRSTAADGSDDEAYDAVARTMSSHLVTGGQKALNIQSNVAFAPPDQGTREGDALAQYVQSLQAAGDAGVTPTTLLGRAAYRMQFGVNTPTIQFDHADVTIDAQTGLLLLIDTTRAGKPYERWQVMSFNTAPDMSKVSFAIAPAGGDDVNRSDDAFIDTQVNLIKSQVGYAPLIPATVPPGFTISRVITHAAKGETTGANGNNPQNQGVVDELFNGPGWQKLYVTTRLTGGDPMRWADPLATVTGEFTGTNQTLAVSAGGMNAAKGELVVAPAESPHIWVAGTALVATVSGPFAPDTLTAAMNSLG